MNYELWKYDKDHCSAFSKVLREALNSAVPLKCDRFLIYYLGHKVSGTSIWPLLLLVVALIP